MNNKMIIDLHTHTIASGHAYSSLNEMAQAASDLGLDIMATTDHAPKMPGGAHLYHFHNLRSIPDYISGVRILKGVEANIIDFNGSIDLPLEVLDELEFVIASFHNPCINSGSEYQTTEALLKIMTNKNVNMIGHPEDKRYRFDIPTIVNMAKESKTLLEVNNSSLLPTTFREGSREGIIKILEECGKISLPIALGSDAHHTSTVGRFKEALELIDEIGFPRDLIVNSDSKKLMNYLGLSLINIPS